jgi:chromosomal replication initiator protein
MLNLIFPIDRRFTFSNFVTGENNKLAKAAAMEIAKGTSRTNLLFIWSPSGLGKTHLLHAIGNEVLENGFGARVIYIPANEFMREFMTAYQENILTEFRRKYRDMCDVLLIDDINLLETDSRSATREEIFETVNYLLITKKRIVITADKPPHSLKNFESKLISRFQWGRIVEIKPPPFDVRVAILKAKAYERGYKVPDEVIYYIAERISGNVRWLEGALETVVMFAEIEEKEPNLELAERALSQLNVPLKNVDAKKIIEITAKFFNLDPKEIQSPRRKKNISMARQIAIYLCREMLNLSTTQIGQIFGNRDHSTVIYAIEKVKAEKEKDSSLQMILTSIRETILGEASGSGKNGKH